MRRGVRLLILLTVLYAGVAATDGSAATAASCDRSEALAAAENSAIPSRFHRAWPSFPPFDQLDYSTFSLLCRRNLMGSDRAGMVALLRCCTVSSPTVLGVFWAENGTWQLAESQVHRLIWRISFRSRELIEKTPVYSFPHDSNCCPSHFRYYRLHYDGHGRFHTITGGLVRR